MLKIPILHCSMINCFLRNLFHSIPSYFSHSLICPDTLVGDYNIVYIYIFLKVNFDVRFHTDSHLIPTVCKRGKVFETYVGLLGIIFQIRDSTLLSGAF